MPPIYIPYIHCMCKCVFVLVGRALGNCLFLSLLCTPLHSPYVLTADHKKKARVSRRTVGKERGSAGTDQMTSDYGSSVDTGTKTTQHPCVII